MTIDYTGSSDISFNLSRGEEGISGFTLKGISTEAECFCVSFVSAQQTGKARIVYDEKNQSVTFYHDGIELDDADERLSIYGTHEEARYIPDLTPEDAIDLYDFVNGVGKYEGVKMTARYDMAFGKGFELHCRTE